MMILFWGVKLIKSQGIEEGRIYVIRLYFSGTLGLLLIIVNRIKTDSIFGIINKVIRNYLIYI